MTRSEEQVRVGTETREAGRVRLRKYVVTENVTQTVPVSREEVRLEREPITDANRDEALAGGDITEEEHEVVLTEERPVVQKETVPVERVRVGKDTVTEQHEVDETVRKEEIELDDSDGTVALHERPHARRPATGPRLIRRPVRGHPIGVAPDCVVGTERSETAPGGRGGAPAAVPPVEDARARRSG